MKNKILSGFWANLMGVILGILLTFGVNALWQRHEEAKKTREMLIMVRNELETNKYWFKNQEEQIIKDGYGYRKILEANKDWSTIPIDSLGEYVSRIFSFTMSTLTTSAWQIFQNSETIQKISNKEMVILLTETYFAINKCHDFIIQHYWDKKMKANPFEISLYDILDAMMSNKETVHFFNENAEPGGKFQDLFFIIDAQIDYTLLVLDKYGDFKYDNNANDKEYQAFMEARRDSIQQKMIP